MGKRRFSDSDYGEPECYEGYYCPKCKQAIYAGEEVKVDEQANTGECPDCGVVINMETLEVKQATPERITRDAVQSVLTCSDEYGLSLRDLTVKCGGEPSDVEALRATRAAVVLLIADGQAQYVPHPGGEIRVRAIRPSRVNTNDLDELEAHVEDDIRAAQTQRLLCCVCPACAVVRSQYPDWQSPSVARLHKSEYELTVLRGICSHPDCTLAIETYCSSCRVKLCRLHLGQQRIGADVVCVACRNQHSHDVA